MSELNTLNLDEIEEEPRYLIVNEKKYDIANLSLGETFKYQALVEAAERQKAADNAEAFAVKMRSATMMLIPEMTVEDFESIRGKKLDAFMDFVIREATKARAGENPTEPQSGS